MPPLIGLSVLTFLFVLRGWLLCCSSILGLFLVVEGCLSPAFGSGGRGGVDSGGVDGRVDDEVGDVREEGCWTVGGSFFSTSRELDEGLPVVCTGEVGEGSEGFPGSLEVVFWRGACLGEDEDVGELPDELMSDVGEGRRGWLIAALSISSFIFR